jgi:hypothetical protein
VPFRTKKFLDDNFQTVQGLLAFLRAYSAPMPNLKTVEKWFQRQSIPSEWLPVLLAYLEIDRGGPISLVAYLEGV